MQGENNTGEFQLDNFSRFLDSFQPKEQHTFHLGQVTISYFYMAETQTDSFAYVAVSTIYNHIDRSLPVKSYVAGTYGLLRTCLEASRKLADEFAQRSNSAELKAYRERHTKNIRNIVYTCNDLIKHPISVGNPLFCEPGGFDTDGYVTFYQYSVGDPEYFKQLKVNPRKDLEIVFNYLEGLAQIYIKIIADIEVNESKLSNLENDVDF